MVFPMAAEYVMCCVQAEGQTPFLRSGLFRRTWDLDSGVQTSSFRRRMIYSVPGFVRMVRVSCLVIVVVALAYTASCSALRCYCGIHYPELTINLPCSSNNNTCETESRCFVRKFVSGGDIVTEWDCLPPPIIQNLANINRQCSGGLNNDNMIFKCCNDSDYCNLGLEDEICLPQEAACSSSTPIPSSSSSTSPTPQSTDTSSQNSDSDLYLGLSIGVIVVTVIVLTVVAISFITILVRFHKLRRHERLTVN